ncbi:MAG TPA: FtsQ-type POTRA domain-containing protein [Myxococcales bacterium]|nr:FtsQ-type POTRA domain-containing protein [Myxococcales bacterium]
MSRSVKRRRRQDAGGRSGGIREALAAHRPALLRAGGAVAAVAACALLGVSGWRWAEASPRFTAQRISFRGLHRAPEAELLKLSGLSLGQNLLHMDLGAATRQMAAHPWVKQVTARRRFPSAVEVEVTEHVPVAALSMGDLYAVDAEGAPFKRLQPGDAVDLPLLTGVDREQYLQDRARWERRLQQALELLQLYQARFPGPGYRLSEVRLSPLGLSVVDGPDGEEVHFGDLDFAEKLDRLQLVRRALAQRALVAEVIRLDDRRRPSRVAVRAAASSSAPGWGPPSERSAAPRPSPEKGKAR